MPHPQQFSPKPPIKKKKHRFVKLIIFLVIALTLVYGGNKLLSKANQIFDKDQNIFVRVGKFFTSGDKPLIGEDEGKINVLLLGVGGEGHDGPLLTDTMILASLDPISGDAFLISIPRDFVVQFGSQGFRKINGVYPISEKSNPGSGSQAAIEAVEKLTGFDIPYYALIDFQGFIKAVDHVGGLDIIIDRTFSDSQYPDSKNWYLPTITFTKGFEHMDGERALQFARSRHGNNSEGSDFARSERQKKIITTFKEKVFQLNINDLKTINNLLGDFTDHFRTNIEPHEIKRFMELGKNINKDHVYSLSLEPQGDLICSGIIEDYVNRAYVIQPCEGKTYADIQKFLKNYELIAKLKKENAVIEIQNSTNQTSATKQWSELSNAGLDIRIASFKGRLTYDRTILYKNTSTKPQTLEYLKNNYDFVVADVLYNQSSADFVIILGKDSL
jgi:LCP family protein required for cell wall assembly